MAPKSAREVPLYL